MTLWSVDVIQLTTRAPRRGFGGAAFAWATRGRSVIVMTTPSATRRAGSRGLSFSPSGTDASRTQPRGGDRYVRRRIADLGHRRGVDPPDEHRTAARDAQPRDGVHPECGRRGCRDRADGLLRGPRT